MGGFRLDHAALRTRLRAKGGCVFGVREAGGRTLVHAASVHGL